MDLTFPVEFDKARVYTVTATVVLTMNGEDFTFTKDLSLDVLDADALVYIGIDASHYNEYVSGNYKDSMGNFSNLAAGYSVRTVQLNTSEDLIAACGNEKYKAIVLTAPSRRLADAQTNPKTYSAAELEAITAFNDRGGTVVLAGWSDNYENYDVIQNNPAIKHMAETQNDVLAALGSSLRISDDATYDDVRSAADGVDKWRLYFSSYNMANPLLEGVEVDEEHPYDKMYTERPAITAVLPSMPWTLPAIPPLRCPTPCPRRSMATPPPIPWTWIRTARAAQASPSMPTAKMTIV